MERVLFSIKNLLCAYDRLPENKVLSIEHLEIPKGKLVFLLGASGCGKSTLLETLGLMNNTVASGSILLNVDNSKIGIDLPALWNDSNTRQLTEVRKQHYSFIFQNTNLMENFTAYENVCLSGMIKKNVPQSDVIESARTLMEKIKLPETEVDLQTLAVNLSGGQRQRLAFVRALNNEATILFGDEPTGNLDEANANELFEIIRSNLNKSLSAIVVSHDINLAVKYADQIIVITKDQGKDYGEVKPENIFNRENWINRSADSIIEFKDKLRSFYRTNSEHKVGNAIVSKGVNTDLSIDYSKLFLKKEGIALLGKKKSNFYILSLILTFTFLAIGFANGSLDYLNKKLNDAFVNWVPISIPNSQASKLTELEEDLKDESLKSRYLINKATPYVRTPLRVWDPSIKRFNYSISRSIDVEEDKSLLNDFILEEGNIIKSKLTAGFKDANDIGVIVQKDFLDEYGYPADANVIYCPFRVKDTITNLPYDVKVPIPIRAIVKRLPGKYGVLYPLYFYSSFMLGRDNIFDTSTHTNNVIFFLESSDSKTAMTYKKLIENFCKKDTDLEKFHPGTVYQTEDTFGVKAGFKYEITFDSTVNNQMVLNNLLGKIKLNATKGNLDTMHLIRIFDFSGIEEVASSFRFDELSVYFDRLDSIREFQRYLYVKGNAKENQDIIQLDDAKVKEKENYLFLSKVTNIISVLLVGFSTLAVCLFIFNLLVSHLAKVKMNIGTFKAIGLTDKEALNIYFKIILYFISISAIISFVVATIIGKVINYYFSNHTNQESNISYFKMIDFSELNSVVNLITLSVIFIILFSSISISRITIRRTLSKTPGDLIYNR